MWAGNIGSFKVVVVGGLYERVYVVDDVDS